MANRALQTQRQGTEIAGHNLANVNTPGYTRQRVAIETSLHIPTQIGPQGTGADAVAIRQIRDALLDRQIVGETSVRGSFEAQQEALQLGQAALSQQIDRQATGAEGSSAASGVGGQHGIAEQLSDLFNAFQSLSTNPTSTAERQVLIIKAQNLAGQFGQVSGRLVELQQTMNDALATDVEQANLALNDIAKLNQQIIAAEVGGGQANDLRDIRQQRLEALAALVNVDATAQAGGGLDLAVDGVTLVSGGNVLEELETYDAGGGRHLIRTTTSGTALNVTGGSLRGMIDARDGELAGLRTEIDTLAGSLISEVNALHAGGYGLAGTTGESFFTGTTASDIAVNASLVSDLGKIQASGEAGAVGDNAVILALAQLAEKKVAALGNQSFTENYGQSVAKLGQALSNVNTQLGNQQIVEQMLARQRDSVSGVSLDEEMTDLIKYQRAFEASARMITTVDTMLETVLNLKR